jgi:hypothetical protein
MSRRWIIACVVLGCVIVAAEIGFKLAVPSSARLDVVNETGETIENLVVIFGDTRIALGNLAAGQFASAWITADQPGTVKLDFRQKNNGMNGIEIGDYDLSKDARGGFKLVVVVRKNQVERYMDDDDRMTWEKLGDRIKEWLGVDRLPGIHL